MPLKFIHTSKKITKQPTLYQVRPGQVFHFCSDPHDNIAPCLMLNMKSKHDEFMKYEDDELLCYVRLGTRGFQYQYLSGCLDSHVNIFKPGTEITFEITE